MITCFEKKCNEFDKISLESIKSHEERELFIQSFMPVESDITNKTCPNCGCSTKLTYFASYERNISFLINNSIQNFKVIVVRCKCASCSSTHALLPSFIVPYKIMASFSILEIVATSFNSTALKTAALFGISHQLIYKYIELLLSFFGEMLLLNNNYETISNFNENYLLKNALEFYDVKYNYSFFYHNKWLFLMTKFRNNSPPGIYIGARSARVITIE